MTLRSVEERPIIAKPVVVALEVVALPTTFRLPLMVVEPTATKPPPNVRVVVVALPGKRYPKFV